VCGGCRAEGRTDWATPFLASLQARAAAAVVLTAAARRPSTVRAVPGGWVVRRPTGASELVGTLSDLVSAVGPAADAEVPLGAAATADLPPPDRRRPVVLVHGRAERCVDAEADGWAERLMTASDPSGTVASSQRPELVLAALLADPLRRHVRVVGLQSPSLPGWRSPSGGLPGVPTAVVLGYVPAVVALIGVRLGGRAAAGRTRTEVGVGARRLVVEACGHAVLSAVVDEPATRDAGPRRDTITRTPVRNLR